jgi:hypothetical protein
MQLEIGKTIRIINFSHILLILNFYLWGEIVVQTCKANQKIMFGGNLKIIKHLSSLLCNILWTTILCSIFGIRVDSLAAFNILIYSFGFGVLTRKILI